MTDERRWLDRLCEGATRALARRTSRRSFLTRLGTALAGLVPVRPRALLWVDALTVAGATAALAAVYASLERVIAYAPGLSRVRGDA